MTEQYQCKSYSDDNHVVQDCTCGKCVESNVESLDLHKELAYFDFLKDTPMSNNPECDQSLYGFLLERVERLLLTQSKAQEARCVAVVKDYGERMSKLQIEFIGTAHDDCKQMLAYDMHSRLIAVKHITEALTHPTIKSNPSE